jgi:hypothetical protein
MKRWVKGAAVLGVVVTVAATLTGCDTRTPFGVIHLTESPTGNQITVSGWALDLDSGHDPIQVELYVDGNEEPEVGMIANLPRDDVPFADAVGNDHGYQTTLTVGTGMNHVCAIGIDLTDGARGSIGCQSTPVPVHGGVFFDSVTQNQDGSTHLIGWAYSGDSASTSWDLSVNGEASGQIQTDVARPDVNLAVGEAPPNPSASPGARRLFGFDIEAATSRSSDEICLTDTMEVKGCTTVDVAAHRRLPPSAYWAVGRFDVISGGVGTLTFAGWIFSEGNPDDQTTASAVPVDTLFTIVETNSGTRHDQDIVANLDRPDVAALFPYAGPNHGFATTISVPPGNYSVCFHDPYPFPVGCRVATVS